MKKFLTIVVLTIFWCVSAQAKVIELKGFKLGMTKKEFKQLWKTHRVKVRQNIYYGVLGQHEDIS